MTMHPQARRQSLAMPDFNVRSTTINTTYLIRAAPLQVVKEDPGDPRLKSGTFDFDELPLDVLGVTGRLDLVRDTVTIGKLRECVVAHEIVVDHLCGELSSRLGTRVAVRAPATRRRCIALRLTVETPCRMFGCFSLTIKSTQVPV